MIPVVLAGGSGTRLWPVSREQLPKQFSGFFSQSLLLQTLIRLYPEEVQSSVLPWIVASNKLKILVEKTLRQARISRTTCIFEPLAKNTAPAIAAACRLLQLQGHSNDTVGFFPADHFIGDDKEFWKILSRAEDYTSKDKLVIFGVEPSRAATEYGYIELDSWTSSESMEPKDFFTVQAFREKPDPKTASTYFKSGSHVWNAGVFVAKVSTFIRLFNDYAREVWQPFENMKEDLSNIDQIYADIPSISFDYAVVEKIPSRNLICGQLKTPWSDLGSWEAIGQACGQNQEKPIVVIDDDMTNDENLSQIDSYGVILKPHGDKYYGFVDTLDLVVIDTADALLISKKGSTQKVKNLVEQIAQKRPNLVVSHVFEERPWGKFEIIRDNSNFKAKIVSVEPGGQLSLQSHKYREEHWIILEGVGEIELDGQIRRVEKAGYVVIPRGAKHRIRNREKTPLKFFEIQLGDYFGEDDIIRYADDYNRTVEDV